MDRRRSHRNLSAQDGVFLVVLEAANGVVEGLKLVDRAQRRLRSTKVASNGKTFSAHIDRRQMQLSRRHVQNFAGIDPQRNLVGAGRRIIGEGQGDGVPVVGIKKNWRGPAVGAAGVLTLET